MFVLAFSIHNLFLKICIHFHHLPQSYICFLSDNQGRYAYDQQPEICRWNMTKLAEALAPNGLTEDKVKEGLEMYSFTEPAVVLIFKVMTIAPIFTLPMPFVLI